MLLFKNQRINSTKKITEATETETATATSTATATATATSTPQYGFNRGMKEFGELGYEATRAELDDNLIGMDAVKMLSKKEITSGIYHW